MSEVSANLVASIVTIVDSFVSVSDIDRDEFVQNLTTALSGEKKTTKRAAKTSAKSKASKKTEDAEGEDEADDEEQTEKPKGKAAKKTAKSTKAAKATKATGKATPLAGKQKKVPVIKTEQVGEYERVMVENETRIVLDAKKRAIGQLNEDDETLDPLSEDNLAFCESSNIVVAEKEEKKSKVAPKKPKAAKAAKATNPKAKVTKKSPKDDIQEEGEGELDENEEEGSDVEEDEEN